MGELIVRAEAERERLGLPPVDCEVGTEEVHGGLTDLSTLRRFIQSLHEALAERDLLNAWPCFIVAQVGTDLHTGAACRQLYDNLQAIMSNPHGYVIRRIAQSIDRYVIAFRLFDTCSILNAEHS